MAADICPVTRKRCNSPTHCNSKWCSGDSSLRPIFERDLTKAEQYALAMSEKEPNQCT